MQPGIKLKLIIIDLDSWTCFMQRESCSYASATLKGYPAPLIGTNMDNRNIYTIPANDPNSFLSESSRNPTGNQQESYRKPLGIEQESHRHPKGIQQESSRNPIGIQQKSNRNPGGIQSGSSRNRGGFQ